VQVRNYPVQVMGLTANHKKTTKEHADVVRRVEAVQLSRGRLEAPG
jgi:hypothetical protein